MKLNDIIDIKNLPCLNEILDTRFETIEWIRKSPRSFEAHAVLGTEDINLSIDLETFKTDAGKYVLADLNFDRLVDGTPKTTTLSTSQLMGAVGTAFLDQLKKLDSAVSGGIDAYFFQVVNNQEFFKTLMRKKIGGEIIQTNTEIGTVIISIRKTFSKEEEAAFLQHIKQHGKKFS